MKYPCILSIECKLALWKTHLLSPKVRLYLLKRIFSINQVHEANSIIGSRATTKLLISALLGSHIDTVNLIKLYATLCYAVLCNTILYNAMPYSDVQCYTMLWYSICFTTLFTTLDLNTWLYYSVNGFDLTYSLLPLCVYVMCRQESFNSMSTGAQCSRTL